MVLDPGPRVLRYACFRMPGKRPWLHASVGDYRLLDNGMHTLRELRSKVNMAGVGGKIDCIGVRIRHSGVLMDGPAVLTGALLDGLKERALSAPLHLPPLLEVLRGCAELFGGIPIVCVSETAFFTRLPERERSYAIREDAMSNTDLKRMGFHGIYHEAAYRYVCGRGNGHAGKRVISICLERQPEIAAVMNGSPLMVTSGSTPLEGIPGETASGEIDPGIVIALAREKGWGPEKINAVLTCESGLGALLGHTVTLRDVFLSKDRDAKFARALVRYRMLCACGAGIAAMGGLDVIVFSGRYRSLGAVIGPRLSKRCSPRGAPGRGTVAWDVFPSTLDYIIADVAFRYLRLNVQALPASLP
jgi:acetate kinase